MLPRFHYAWVVTAVTFVALIFFVPMLVVIVWRLVDEEHHLAERLAGYEDYRRKTRYRLVPLVW